MVWIFNRDRLAALRELNGLSQEQFAARLGTPKQQVSRWEVGKYKPSLDSLLKISNLFNVSPSYFFACSEHQNVRQS